MLLWSPVEQKVEKTQLLIILVVTILSHYVKAPGRTETLVMGIIFQFFPLLRRILVPAL